MKGEHIGELEELVLLAVGSLSDLAYAVAILDVIVKSTNRTLDVTAIHAVLRRLEKKGYVISSMGEGTPERGGQTQTLFYAVSGQSAGAGQYHGSEDCALQQITAFSFY